MGLSTPNLGPLFRAVMQLLLLLKGPLVPQWAITSIKKVVAKCQARIVPRGTRVLILGNIETSSLEEKVCRWW